MSKICKVLVVEDHREIQDMLKVLFADEGYRFIVVGDGPAMRRALDRDPAIDVAIIDVLLPGGIDGLTLAGEVAARGLPVILVTGDHTQIDGLKASGRPYLLKPFALAAFLELIERILRETKAECERDPNAARVNGLAQSCASAAAEPADISIVELPLADEAAASRRPAPGG